MDPKVPTWDVKTGFLKETDNFQKGVPHKPARLYTFVEKKFTNDNNQKFKFY